MKSPALFSLSKGAYNGLCATLCVLAVVGCSEEDQRPQITTLASSDGGGVSGGQLSDTLTIYALDADSGNAIANASVSLGVGQSAHKVGQTGSDGKLVVSGLGGVAQMVSVNASGYVAATWGLVQSAIARIPLESTADPPGDAMISLTIPGWSDLPPVASGLQRIARFAISRPKGLEALEAALDSPALACTETDTPTDCAVTLSVPTDSTTVLAVIAEGTDAGTSDPSDDMFTVTRLGIQTGLTLQEGIRTSLALPLLDPTSVARAQLVTTAPAAGTFEDVIGVPGISMDGQILLYPSLGALSTSFLVPTSSGPFVNAKLWAVATASNDSDVAWSRVYERGIDPPDTSSDMVSLATGAFIEAPVITKTGPSAYALTGDGNLQRLEFATPSGQQLNVLLFPTQTDFEIPAGILDEEPSSVSVESFDLELDLTSFDFSDLAQQSTRIAYARVDAL